MLRNRSGVSAKTLVGVVAITFLIAQAPAKADDAAGGFEIPPEAAALGLLLLLGEGYLLVGGTVVGMGNLVYASDGERATSGWRYQGYILGSLNVVIGGIMIGAAIKNHDQDLGILGAVQAGVGMADLGFTIWSQVQEDGSRRSVSVSPLVIPDREGAPAMGVGVQLVGW
jgi:hypothetical protein